MSFVRVATARTICFLILVLLNAYSTLATGFFVSPAGNDGNGDGSQSNPWKTLVNACQKVPPGQGHIIHLTAGTFIEMRIEVPVGISIRGAGRDLTIIRSDPAFYHFPADPGFSVDKFLINLNSNVMSSGQQSIRDLTVEGDQKKLHGAIYVRNRTNVLIQGVGVRKTNFTGIWLWDVQDSRITDVKLEDCAWGSSKWSSAALCFANLERVEIDHLNVDEGFGEGVKSLGTNGTPGARIHHLDFHDNRISVTPAGKWKTASGGSAPNIAFELWNSDLRDCNIYNNYIDNTISLVMDKPQFAKATGQQTVHIHHNIIDLESRAKGEGYALEIMLHDAEIDHNYISKGKWGIVNWAKDGVMTNWDIHHNVFFGISNVYPSNVVLSQHTGLHDVKFYNNTVEFVGTRTTNLFGIKGGPSENIQIKNNLIINSNTAYSHYPNKLILLENGATIQNLEVTNNLLVNLPMGEVAGVYKYNLTADPKIERRGARPTPYYLPGTGSPLIDAGQNMGYSYEGKAPDIGAFEYTGR